MKRKLLSFLLAVCTAVTLVLPGTGTAFSAAAAVTNGCEWNFQNGVLTVGGTIPLNEAPWAEYIPAITRIEFDESVTRLPDYSEAFSYYPKLESVYFPAGLEEAGYGYFSGCEKLHRVELSPQNRRFEVVDDVLYENLYGMKSIVLYPAGKLDTVYTVPKELSYVSGWTLSDHVTEIRTEAGHPSLFVEDGILYERDSYQNETRLVCYPRGRENFVYTVPAEVTEIEKWDLPDTIGEFRAEPGNPKYTAVSGVLYEKQADGSLSLVKIPERLSARTLTLPKNFTAGELHNYDFPFTLQEIKVEAGNTRFWAENGVLYERTSGGASKFVCYPSGRRESVYTVPKEVSSGIDSYNLPRGFLRAVRVEKGNTGYLSVSDVLYQKKGSSYSLICYPERKTSKTYVVPAKVTSGISAGNLSENLSAISVSQGNPKYYAYKGVLYEKTADGNLSLLCYPQSKTDTGYYLPAKVVSGIDSGSFPEKVAGITASKSNRTYMAAGGVLYKREGSNYSLVCYPRGKTSRTYTVPSKVISGIESYSFPYCLTSIGVSKGNRSYASYSGVLYEKQKDGSLKLLCYPQSKSGTSFNIASRVTAGVETASFPAKLKTVTVSKSNPVYTAYSSVVYRKNGDGTLNLACYPTGRGSSYTIPKNVVGGVDRAHLWDTLRTIKSQAGNPVYLARNNVLYEKRYDGSYALSYYPDLDSYGYKGAVIDSICAEIDLRECLSGSLVVPEGVRISHPDNYNDVVIVGKRGGRLEASCKENGIVFRAASSAGLPAVTGFQAVNSSGMHILSFRPVSNAAGYQIYQYNPRSRKYYYLTYRPATKEADDNGLVETILYTDSMADSRFAVYPYTTDSLGNAHRGRGKTAAE